MYIYVGGERGERIREGERETETIPRTIFSFLNLWQAKEKHSPIKQPPPLITFCRHLFSFENSNMISFDLLNFLLKLQQGAGSLAWWAGSMEHRISSFILDPTCLHWESSAVKPAFSRQSRDRPHLGAQTLQSPESRDHPSLPACWRVAPIQADHIVWESSWSYL